MISEEFKQKFLELIAAYNEVVKFDRTGETVQVEWTLLNCIRSPFHDEAVFGEALEWDPDGRQIGGGFDVPLAEEPEGFGEALDKYHAILYAVEGFPEYMWATDDWSGAISDPDFFFEQTERKLKAARSTELRTLKDKKRRLKAEIEEIETRLKELEK